MNKSNLLWLTLLVGLLFSVALVPEDVHAQLMAGGLESKMQNLTKKIVTVILPLFSVLGLVYASILAVSGDVAAKSRITTVIICSVIGFLAPYIIYWFKSAAGQ